MKNKKSTLILAALIATSMLSGAVYAEEPATNDVVLVAEAEQEAQPTHASYSGTIAEVGTEDSVSYILLGEGEDIGMRLNISEATVIIHSDGTPAAADELIKGAQIAAYHSLATTRSLPPQSVAEVLVIMAEDATAMPLYGTVGSVNKTDDGMEITTADGAYLFFVDEETEIMPYKTRNIVKAEDLTAGRKFIAWSEVVTLSLPGQAHPSKVMLLPEPVAEPVEEGIFVKGEAFTGEVKEQDGTTLLPIRAISEQLGYTVTWNGEDRSVRVSDENSAVTVVLGETAVTTVARSAASLEKAPVLIDGVTYVTADFFTLLTGDANSVQING